MKIIAVTNFEITLHYEVMYNGLVDESRSDATQIFKSMNNSTIECANDY